MDCQEFEELSGAYTLGAITDEERQAARMHVAWCPSCRRILQELQDVTDLLPLAVPTAEPSRQLKDRIMATIRGEMPRRTLSQRRVPHKHRRQYLWWQHWQTRLIAIAAVLLFILLSGMMTWNISLQRQFAQVSHAVPSPAIYRVHGTAAATTANGQLISLPQQRITVLVVHGLPSLTGTQVYQGWLIEGEHPKSIGLLNRQDGAATLTFPGDVKGYDAIAVSIEPGPKPSQNTPKGQVIAMGLLQRTERR